jgi:hypothetical protein
MPLWGTEVISARLLSYFENIAVKIIAQLAKLIPFIFEVLIIEKQ